MKPIFNLILGISLLLFISCGDDDKTLISTPSEREMAIEDAVHHLEDGPFEALTPETSKANAINAVANTTAASQLEEHKAFNNINASTTTNFVWLSIEDEADIAVAINSSDVKLAFYDADGDTVEIEIEASGEEDGKPYSIIHLHEEFLIIGFSSDTTTTFTISFAVLGEENHSDE